jgi:hypothetical protein
LFSFIKKNFLFLSVGLIPILRCACVVLLSDSLSRVVVPVPYPDFILRELRWWSYSVSCWAGQLVRSQIFISRRCRPGSVLRATWAMAAVE